MTIQLANESVRAIPTQATHQPLSLYLENHTPKDRNTNKYMIFSKIMKSSVTVDVEAEEQKIPFVIPRSSLSSSLSSLSLDIKERTGTIWTALAHIVTGVIGAGVLSLAWSVAQLGWLAGPAAILVFAVITLVSTFLLCDCYKSPDPINGPIRNSSFMEAVSCYLGEHSRRICGVLLHESIYGTCIAYTIAASFSSGAIQRSNCYHKEGHEAFCEYKDSTSMLLFGAIQIVMSQIPDFHNMAWLSIAAAIMSLFYSFTGMGLGLAKVIENGAIKGSIRGIPANSLSLKLSTSFQALGDIAFAYPYSIILLEIQDTLKSPPSENQTMKKASTTAIAITTFFYLCCACFGYAAFGNDTPGNLLTGFGFYEPYWLVDFANVCIIVHLVGGYQVFSQPLYALGEKWFMEKYPDSEFMNKFHPLKLPLLPAFHLNSLRLCFRTMFVISTTGLAIIFPYFNQVLGILGAFNFWPLTIYFPVKMYFVQRKIESWSRSWVILQGFSIVCLLVSILAFIGSLQELVRAKFS